MNKFSPEQIELVRQFAMNQWYNDDHTVTVTSDDVDQEIHCPWIDCSGRWELDTIDEVIDEWGEDLLVEFCEKALAYMKGV